MLKLAFASIRRRKARFALITLAVASGVGLYFGSLVLVNSLAAEAQRLAYEGVEATEELWSAQETDFVILDDSQYTDEFETGEETDGAIQLDTTALTVLKEAGLQIKTAVGFVETSENIVVLQGDRVLSGYFGGYYVSHTEEEDFNDFSIVEGQPPLAAGQIALDKKLASAYYVELGEVITLKYKETEETEEGTEEEVEVRDRDFEIVGFAVPRFRHTDRENTDESSFGNVIQAEDLRYLLGYEEEQLSRINIKAEPANGRTWAAEDLRALNEKLPDGLTLRTGEAHYTEIELQRDLLYDVGDFTESLNGLVQITIIIAAFTIFNVFNVVLRQRTDELALLRALSFSRFRAFRLIMTESLIMALVATAAGLALGAGVGFLLTRFGGLLFEDAPDVIKLIWDWQALIWPAVLGMTITLAASLPPAWRASRLRPAAVLAGRHSQFKSFKLRLIFGLILLGLGGILIVSFIVEHRADLSSEIQTILQLNRFAYGILLTLGGVFVLMPIILHYLLRAAGHLLRPLAGSGFSLVLGNLGQQLRHSSININMLIVIIALIIGALVSLQSFLVFFRQNPSELLVNDWSLHGGYENEEGDIFIPDEAVEQLAASDTITNLNMFRFIDMIKTDAEPLEEPSEYEPEKDGLSLQALDADTFRGYTNIRDTKFSEKELAALASGKILVRDDTMQRYGWRQNQKIKLTFENGSSSEYVVGSALETPKGIAGDADFVLDNEFHASHLDDWPIKIMSFDTADGYNHQDVAKIIEDMQRQHRQPFYPDSVTVLSPFFWEDLDQSIDLEIQQQLSSLGNYFILPFAVALFGMACTLSLAISERRREIGILRALGFSRGQIRAGVCLEAVIVVLIGILIGGPLGALFSWMYLLLLESIFSNVEIVNFSATFAMPWLWFGVYGLAGIVLAILAGLWPAFRASRLNIVQAINDRL